MISNPVRCPSCNKMLAEELNGFLRIMCSRCKSVLKIYRKKADIDTVGKAV